MARLPSLNSQMDGLFWLRTGTLDVQMRFGIADRDENFNDL